jgi:serine/threonine-protein kinase
MDAATWRWAKGLLADALQLPREQRAAFLRNRCRDDVLRSEIASLVDLYEASHDFLADSAATTGAPSLEELQLAPGRVFAGRYRIVSFLGRGGMGEVYRADDLKLTQQVALKFLPSRLAADHDRLARFTAEVRIARTVSHPNVCRVFDIGDDEGLHYLSMEYVDGDNLASLLRRLGRLHPEKAADLARQLCDGVAAAHDRGVLHRDLKPANILIDGTGCARIVDFGLAVASGGGGVREIAGTPAYMAPEQLAGGPVTEQTDLFALGLVIHEMFTGHRSSDAEHGSAVRDTNVPAIVAQCLRRMPSERPASAAAVAAGLADAGPQAARAGSDVAADPRDVPVARRFAWVALISIAIGALATASASSVSTVRPADIPNSPESLALKAREILAGAGFPATRKDSEFGFAGGNARTPIQFLYRESASYLLPRNLFRLVTEDDPPQEEPGMASVVLDPKGRLLRFSAIPPAAAEATGMDASWARLFSDAGIDESQFVRVDGSSPIPTAYDSAVYWQPRNGSGGPRVAAATRNGRPVYFEVTESPASRRQSRNVLVSRRPPAFETMLWSLIAVAFAVAAVLARRALTTGAVDRVVPIRLSVFIVCASVAFSLLRGHHVPFAVEEATSLLSVCGWALMWATFTALAYIGVGRYATGVWPGMFTSFAQLVHGRFRNPRIGRDVLIGLLAGEVIAGVFCLSNVLTGGYPPDTILVPALQALQSPRHLLAEFLFHPADAMQFALGGVLFLLVLRLALRNVWLSAAIWLALVAPISTGAPYLSTTSWIVFHVAIAIAIAAFGLVIIVRYGLLAAIVMLLTDRLLTQMPVTLDSSAWYFGSSLAVLLAVGTLAVYGFIVALGGQPAFAELP